MRASQWTLTERLRLDLLIPLVYGVDSTLVSSIDMRPLHVYMRLA